MDSSSTGLTVHHAEGELKRESGEDYHCDERDLKRAYLGLNAQDMFSHDSQQCKRGSSSNSYHHVVTSLSVVVGECGRSASIRGHADADSEMRVTHFAVAVETVQEVRHGVTGTSKSDIDVTHRMQLPGASVCGRFRECEWTCAGKDLRAF